MKTFEQFTESNMSEATHRFNYTESKKIQKELDKFAADYTVSIESGYDTFEDIEGEAVNIVVGREAGSICIEVSSENGAYEEFGANQIVQAVRFARDQ